MFFTVENLIKYFPIKKGFLGRVDGFVKAVDGVSLKINSGESLSIVGESGSGKTTLARCMMKLYKADGGRILFKGQDIVPLDGIQFRKYRKNIQMVFQDPFNSLDPRFKIFDVLKEGVAPDASVYKTKKDLKDRMHELLSAVHLKDEMLNRYPHEFSGGERQRIAIARALMLNPKILILDEAVSSLDVIVQAEILALLKNLQDEYGLTYIFISHNLKVVKKVSDRIAVMYKGKIVELGAANDVVNNPLHSYTQQLLRAAIDYKATENIDFDISNTILVEKSPKHFCLE